jgi:hypothetical protein
MNLDHISTDHVKLNRPKGQLMIYKPTQPGKSVRKAIGVSFEHGNGIEGQNGWKYRRIPSGAPSEGFPHIQLSGIGKLRQSDNCDTLCFQNPRTKIRGFCCFSSGATYWWMFLVLVNCKYDTLVLYELFYIFEYMRRISKVLYR